MRISCFLPMTPAEEFKLAAEIGATINLDDITHIEFLEKTLGYLPKTISCRFNPGGYFSLGTDIMDNPGDAKYGFTTEQMFEGFQILKDKGVENFGIHAFLASNTVTNEYYPTLAKQLFELAVQLKEKTGAHIKFINLSGGIGIPYRPDQEPNDIRVIGESVRKVYEEVLVPAGMGDVSIYTELGRFMMGPYGHLVTKVLHQKHTHKEYVGVDACAVNLMRPAMYGAYHHISPATINMMLPVLFARTTINSPLTGCFRKSKSEIILRFMIREHTALPWGIITTAS